MHPLLRFGARALAVLVVTAVIACNGKIQGPCGTAVSGTRQEFCDLDTNARGPVVDEVFPGGGGGDSPTEDTLLPPTCPSVFHISSSTLRCLDPQPTTLRVGDPCSFESDCPSTCCRQDQNRAWYPVPDPAPIVDAGGADVSVDDGGDAGATADASVEPTPTVVEARGYACTCGRCPSPEEICAMFPRPLGGK